MKKEIDTIRALRGSTSSIMSCLEDKKILKLYVSDDQHTIKFSTVEEDIIFEAIGDCCSESWFADIIGVKTLLDGTIYMVEEVEMPGVSDGRSRQEFDSVYGYKILTDKGYTDIIFRNSSNGYYGGWIEIMPQDKCTNCTFEEIVDDWSA